MPETHIGYKFYALVCGACVFCSFIPVFYPLSSKTEGKKKHSPKLILKGHVIRDKAYIENVGGAFKLCPFKFVIDMRGGVNAVTSDDSIIVSVEL